MAAKVDIFNNALVMLGAPTILSVTQNVKSAQVLLSVYDMVKTAELRKRPAWNFSIKLQKLLANAVAPAFGRGYSYPLPPDFLALAPQFPEQNYACTDWLVQDRQIYTADGAGTLNLRYVANVDESLFDPLFVDALSAALAKRGSTSITQSKGVYQLVKDVYLEAVDQARKANAFDNVPMQFPIDPFISVRY